VRLKLKFIAYTHPNLFVEVRLIRTEETMKNMPSTSENDAKEIRPRRTFFRWPGQFAAGASLAGIGLATRPFEALAKQSIPLCPCRVVSCAYNNACRSANPNYPLRVTYIPGDSFCSEQTICTNTCSLC